MKVDHSHFYVFFFLKEQRENQAAWELQKYKHQLFFWRLISGKRDCRRCQQDLNRNKTWSLPIEHTVFLMLLTVSLKFIIIFIINPSLTNHIKSKKFTHCHAIIPTNKAIFIFLYSFPIKSFLQHQALLITSLLQKYFHVWS